MMLICIKEHASNIWSTFHKTLSTAEVELKKSVPFKKSVYFINSCQSNEPKRKYYSKNYPTYLAKFISRNNPLNANLRKWSNTLKEFVGNLVTNCLSVFDHFVKLALKEITWSWNQMFLIWRSWDNFLSNDVKKHI